MVYTRFDQTQRYTLSFDELPSQDRIMLEKAQVIRDKEFCLERITPREYTEILIKATNIVNEDYKARFHTLPWYIESIIVETWLMIREIDTIIYDAKQRASHNKHYYIKEEWLDEIFDSDYYRSLEELEPPSTTNRGFFRSD